MHLIIRIKGQKQESLKGQNQHYKKNITDDVYQRWYDRTNKKIHFITRIKDQKQESLKGQNQHGKKNKNKTMIKTIHTHLRYRKSDEHK